MVVVADCGWLWWCMVGAWQPKPHGEPTRFLNGVCTNYLRRLQPGHGSGTLCVAVCVFFGGAVYLFSDCALLHV